MICTRARAMVNISRFSESNKRSEGRIGNLRVLPPNTLPATQQALGIILVLNAHQFLVVITPPRLDPISRERVGLVAVRATTRGNTLDNGSHVLNGLDLLFPGGKGSVPRPGGTRSQLPDSVTPGGRSTGGSFGVVVQHWSDDGDVRRLAQGLDGCKVIHEVLTALGGLEDGAGDQSASGEASDADSDGAGLDVFLVKGVPGSELFDGGGAAVCLSVGDHACQRDLGLLDGEEGGDVDEGVTSDVAAPSFLSPFQGVVDDDVHEWQHVGAVTGELDVSRDKADGRLDAVSAFEDYAKGSTTATAQGPEEVGVLEFVGGAVDSVWGNDLELEDAVNAETVHGAQDGMATVLDPAA